MRKQQLVGGFELFVFANYSWSSALSPDPLEWTPQGCVDHLNIWMSPKLHTLEKGGDRRLHQGLQPDGQECARGGGKG
jgi:hypothetical protein